MIIKALVGRRSGIDCPESRGLDCLISGVWREGAWKHQGVCYTISTLELVVHPTGFWKFFFIYVTPKTGDNAGVDTSFTKNFL